jgi:MinD superfamily P-loop ATPase
MIVAVASGKGGTGKTTVATNLAHVAAQTGRAVAYLDCDVEAPNGHIFLRPAVEEERPIEKPVPVVDPARCTHCGACGKCEELCRFDATWFDGPGNGRVARTFRVGALACHAKKPSAGAAVTPSTHDERPDRRGRNGPVSTARVARMRPCCGVLLRASERRRWCSRGQAGSYRRGWTSLPMP